MSQTYHTRKAAGLCPRCGGPRTEPQVICLPCRTVENKRYVKSTWAHRFTKPPQPSWSYPPKETP